MPVTYNEMMRLLVLGGGGLEKFNEVEAAQSRAPGKWSRKQILGHLIDSAANTHQLIVRASQEKEVKLPRYDQDHWVESQGYQSSSWGSLLPLWKAYNLHLVNVISRFPPEKLQTPCKIGNDAPVSIDFVIQDYFLHLKHHLHQIFGQPIFGP